MKSIVTLLFTLLLLAACNEPACTNTNPIFDKYAPGTLAYQKELTRLLSQAQQEKLTYWINSVKIEYHIPYLYVDIRGKSICATAKMSFVNIPKLDNVVKANGGGYRGAELEGLKYDINAQGFQIISLDRIVD